MNEEERKIQDAEETGFNQEMVLEFHKSGEKLLTRYKSGPSTGKYIFPNKTEKLAGIIEGMPYRCMVKETETAGFAKIISRVFVPRIIIRKGFVVTTLRENDEVKHIAMPTLFDAIQKFVEKGIYQWVMLFQTDDFKEYSGKINVNLHELWSGVK